MKKIIFIMILFFLPSHLFCQQLQKAKLFNHTQNIDNWLMSEKLDGVRAYWNGKELKTRQGNTIFAPSWFTKNFPSFELDGELWSKRMDFETIQSTVLGKHDNEKWHQIGYHIFEVPNAKGDFIERLKLSQEWFLANKNSHVHIIPQKLCKNKQDLEEFLKEIIHNKGEGVMIKNPNALYEKGRTDSLLKVKQFEDMEGKVIALNYTKENFKSLVIELPNKTSFNLGNGFTQEQRKHPPSVGSIVTFKYYGFTKNGKPKFASFLHERKD